MNIINRQVVGKIAPQPGIATKLQNKVKYIINKSTGRNHYTAIKSVAEKMQKGKHKKSNTTKCEWNRILGFLKPLVILYCTTQRNNPDNQNPNSNKYPRQNHHMINWVKNQDGQETSKPFCPSKIGWATAPFNMLLLTIKSWQQSLIVGYVLLTLFLSTLFHCLSAPLSLHFVYTCRWFITDYKSMYNKKH
jgi:hypothetical protein